MTRLRAGRGLFAAALLLAAVAQAALADAALADPEPSAPLPSPFHLVHPSKRTPRFLDATAPCTPAASSAALEFAARLRDGDITGARRGLAALKRAPEAKRDLALLEATLQARTAVGSTRSANRKRLLEIAERDARPEARACALLESARLALLLDLPLEARVDRARALAKLANKVWPERLAPTAKWLAAEEAHRTGESLKALRLYAELADEPDDRLALAVWLRRAEAAFPVAGPEAASGAAELWAEFPSKLEAAAQAGLDVEPWSLVAGELALRANDPQAAHYWLARAELAWPGGLASIRKADALSALARVSDARNTLERVLRVGANADVRALAGLRIAAFELDAGRPEQARAASQAAARSPHPELRAAALGLLVRGQLAAGAVTQSLNSGVRLVHSGVDASAIPYFRDDMQRALTQITAERVACSGVLQALGSRTTLIARQAEDAAVLLRVADCFLATGMPGAALDAVRLAGRTYGAERIPDLALRMATAALAAGELPAVHAAIDAAAKEPAASPDARLRWRSLAAALAEREGLLGAAFEELVLLSGEDALPIEPRIQAELALVRMLEAGRDAARGVGALEASLAREPAVIPEARAFVWLRLADLRMSAGAVPEARAAYERAATKLPSGALRDRALHHAAFASRAGAERSEALGIAVAAGSRSAWSELSALETQLRQLSEELDDRAMNGQ